MYVLRQIGPRRDITAAMRIGVVVVIAGDGENRDPGLSQRCQRGSEGDPPGSDFFVADVVAGITDGGIAGHHDEARLGGGELRYDGGEVLRHLAAAVDVHVRDDGEAPGSHDDPPIFLR